MKCPQRHSYGNMLRRRLLGEMHLAVFALGMAGIEPAKIP